MLPKLQKNYDLLESELRELLGYLDKLPPEKRLHSARGDWNAVQILHHLNESEKGTASYLAKKIQAPASTIPVGGISAKIRSYLLRRSLRNFARKYKAPSVLKEMPPELIYEEEREEYLKTRMKLKRVLERFESEMLDKAYFKHPRAGRITIIQTLKFLNDHFERHREQIITRSGNG